MALIAHWKFDEPSDTSGADSIVDAQGTHHGTPANAVVSVAGQDGTAFSFNGGGVDTDEINVGNDPALDLSAAPFSITGFLYPKGGGVSTHGRVFIKGSHLMDIRDEVAGVVNIHTKMDSTEGIGGDAINDLTVKLPINTWYFVGYTFDGIDGIIYIDGAVPAQSASSIGTAVSDMSGNDLLFSKSGDAVDGYLDDWRFWNTVLSAGEMLALFNSYSTGGISRLDSIRDILSANNNRVGSTRYF